jgi:carbon monoxide dehydrogenase subunit G
VELQHTFTVPADLATVWQAVLDAELVAPCMPGATLTKVDGDTFSGTVKVKMGPISLLYKGSGEFLEKDETAHRMVLRASGKDARGNGTAAARVTVTLRADGDRTVGAVRTDLTVTGKPAQFGRGMISEVGGKILDAFAACLATRLAKPGSQAEEPGTGQAVPSANGTPASAPATPPAGGAAPAGKPAPARPAAEGATGHRPGLSAVETAGQRPEPNGARQRPRPPLTTAAAEPEAEPLDLLSFAGPSVLKRAAPVLLVLLILLIALARRRRR